MRRHNRDPLVKRTETTPRRFVRGGSHRVEITLTEEVYQAVQAQCRRKEQVPGAVRRLLIERLMQETPTVDGWAQAIIDLLKHPPMPNCRVYLDPDDVRLLLIDVTEEEVVGEVRLPVGLDER